MRGLTRWPPRSARGWPPPVIVGMRLRGGNASSARRAASMITEAVSTARAVGCGGTLVVQMGLTALIHWGASCRSSRGSRRYHGHPVGTHMYMGFSCADQHTTEPSQGRDEGCMNNGRIAGKMSIRISRPLSARASRWVPAAGESWWY